MVAHSHQAAKSAVYHQLLQRFHVQHGALAVGLKTWPLLPAGLGTSTMMGMVGGTYVLAVCHVYRWAEGHDGRGWGVWRERSEGNWLCDGNFT